MDKQTGATPDIVSAELARRTHIVGVHVTTQ